MKKTFISLLSVIFLFLAYRCTSCDSTHTGTDTIPESESNSIPKPLNISVYLDLSDRLTRDLTPSQAERDTAIINHLIDIFVNDAVKNGKIADSKNHFQIFFYPAPKNSQIATLAKGLNVDLEKTDIKDKKIVLRDMKSQFEKSLSVLYSDAIAASNWNGSDVWGFFSNKKVDDMCIRDGYRNILVILTDGYLFDANNKIKEGNAYSYILPQTLAVPESSLIVKRNGLENLDVLMLEINPYDPKQQEALTDKLQNWFSDMGINKFVVANTDLPVNIEHTIDRFME